MRRLQCPRQRPEHHRGGDRDLQRHEGDHVPRTTLFRPYGPPHDISGQCIREQPVRPVDVLQIVPSGHDLPIAERKPEASAGGTEIRGERAEQDGHEAEGEPR